MTMMAAEQAQRLIAMSLGKIAASRNQRGGANLHRSLLVSTVLHKARTTIMMENFQAMMQQRRAQMEAQQRTEMVVGAASSEERPATPAPTAQVEEPQRWDKENTPPPCPPTPSPEVCERLADPTAAPVKEQNNNEVLSSSQHQEQSPKPSPLQQSNSENVITPQTANCAKCLKRRSSELSGADEDFLASKRTKYESDSELSHEPSSRSDCVFENEDSSYNDEESSEEEDSENTCPEPMQTDPVQITNLVHRFNSGLSGLLTQVANESQQLQQCNSDQAFTSCCTQVKDSGIESLSRPCIALTV